MTDLKNTQQPILYKVLLIGDSCFDRYVIGEVERLSPEAPVPIVKIINEYTLPGMSLNVKLNLEKLGLDVDLIAPPTDIVKTRYIDNRSKQHLLRVDDEPIILPFDKKLCQNLESYDAIIISDYDKGFLSYDCIEYIVTSTTKPIFIDTKKTDLKRFSAKNSYIKINHYEYKQRLSTPENLIITQGQHGALLKYQDKEQIFPTKKVEVADVCGAGDTFLAALTCKFLETKSIQEAIIYANKASCLSVQHRGNYAPTHAEILLNT